MDVLIVSGISGSGKTTFLRALEDIGFFCVDNFPLVMLLKFLELNRSEKEKISRLAFVVDVRLRDFFEGGGEIIDKVKKEFGAKMLFLESSEDILVRRYRETRRSHPLFNSSNIKDALKEERELVLWLRDKADQVIDTTHLIPHELRSFVLRKYGTEDQRMKINIMSFGYAFGLPLEADMVLDVRFVPNPFFVEGLRDKTGLNDEVAAFIKSQEVFRKYFLFLSDFLVYLIPLFEKEGKSYLTICFGCTGGKHRSVFIAGELAEQLTAMGYNVSIVHRDIER
ncbi:MAG TPA: RNase adapter RapZ [Syntrophorhabdaceae bacterium]|nr:RNase adapter RapZ [Syntrophorhabdaceae bacterium]